MNTNKMELNLNEMENVNGGFSMEELLVKVGFFIFRPSINKDGAEKKTTTDLKELVVQK